MRAKDGRGKYGERVAAQHLEAAGFEVLDRNWRCPQGELDIVARDGAALVFVEVKTRSSTKFGEPAEAVDRNKCAACMCWPRRGSPPSDRRTTPTCGSTC
jgi:putative endonuclease